MQEVAKAMKLKADLDKLRPIGKEQEAIIMEKFRLDWDYHSNHLEGNSLTFGETKTLILHGITAQGKPLKDHFEITGHDEAIKLIIEVVKDDYPLTEVFIRELHKLLLKESYEVAAITPEGKPTKKRIQIGNYKTSPNHVKTKTGEIFRFASPEETPAMMHDLLKWYNKEKTSLSFNPVILAALFHYKFIRIHPFDDGNGRLARILMNFILMRFGYPPVIIKTHDKNNYFASLQQADGGSFEPFINYIAANLIRSLEIMISGANGESVEEPDDLDKEIALLEQKLKHAGKKLEVLRSKELILELYDSSFKRLMDSFIIACQKFTKFYLKNEFLLVSNKASSKDLVNSFHVVRKSIDKDTSDIMTIWNFETFNRKGLENRSFQSAIILRFGLSNFSILNEHLSLVIEKNYGEQITDEEIAELIRNEKIRHKEFINKNISDLAG